MATREDPLVLFQKLKIAEAYYILDLMKRRCKPNDERVLQLFQPIMDLQRQLNEAIFKFNQEILKMEHAVIQSTKENLFFLQQLSTIDE